MKLNLGGRDVPGNKRWDIPGDGTPAATAIAWAITVCLVLFVIWWLWLHVIAPQVTRDPNLTTRANMKILGLDVMMYAQDHGGRFPDMSNVSAFQRDVMPYNKASDDFVSAATNRPVVPNASLSDKSTTDYPDTTIEIYEDAPTSDGKRVVTFVDGSTERIDNATWDRLSRASGIP
jgi:hypothetical protein